MNRAREGDGLSPFLSVGPFRPGTCELFFDLLSSHTNPSPSPNVVDMDEFAFQSDALATASAEDDGAFDDLDDEVVREHGLLFFTIVHDRPAGAVVPKMAPKVTDFNAMVIAKVEVSRWGLHAWGASVWKCGFCMKGLLFCFR